MTDSLRVIAPTANAYYFPEYVARELGFFEDEGIHITTITPGHGPGIARALTEGTADITLGGIWRPIMYRNRLTALYPFAQVADRCPMVLLSRKPEPEFDWNSLKGRSVMGPGGAPSPYWWFRSALLRRGIDPGSINMIRDFPSPSEAVELFAAGVGDYLLAGPPSTTSLVEQGVAYEVANLWAEGRVPWSAYYALLDFVERSDNVVGRFRAALDRGLTWVREHDPQEAPEVLRAQFPQLKPEVAAKAVRACQALEVWPATTEIPEDSLQSWQEIIKENGMISEVLSYSAVLGRTE